MDKGNYKKLSSYHVVFLVNGILAGVGMLSLPHSIALAKYSEWIVVLALGIFSNLAIIPMIYLAKQYPQSTVFRINEKILGKFIGKFLNVLIVIYFILITATVCREYLKIMQTTALPDMSMTVPLILILSVMVYIASGGIKSIARFSILAFFITFWMVILLRYSISKGEFLHLLPIVQFSWGDFLKAFNKGFMSFTGFELILIYFPYIINPKKAFKHTSLGIWITTIIYVIIVVVSAAYFTTWQLENIQYPVLNLFKAVEFSFIERVENFFISYWIILLMTTTAPLIWAAKKGLDVIINKNQAWFLGLLAVIIFILIELPISVDIQKFLFETLVNITSYIIILIPIPLIIIHKIKLLGGKKYEN